MKPTPTICLLLLLTAPALGLAEGRSGLTSAQAAALAERQYGGKVLRIDTVGKGRYRVKILSNGRVRIVEIDGRRPRGKK